MREVYQNIKKKNCLKVTAMEHSLRIELTTQVNWSANQAYYNVKITIQVHCIRDMCYHNSKIVISVMALIF